MADGLENNSAQRSERQKDEIFSKAVRAGKRTYFFDVKATRGNDYYLTVTESKKKFNDDGKFFYEKHKLFLYKEDFEKFEDGLKEVIDYIKANQEMPVTTNEETKSSTNGFSEKKEEAVLESSFSDVSFEDLGKDNH